MSSGHVIAVNTPRDPGWIAPGSEQHNAMISPSKIGAILGLSRWESPYRLWHRMKGLVPPEPPKDAFDLGHDIEPFAANRWRRKNEGWLLSPGEVQFVVDPDHFGFPALVTLDRRAVRGRSRRVVELKLARDQYDLEKWGDDLSGDLPPDYFVQTLAAMLFTGWTSLPGHVLVLGPTYRERQYEVEYDARACEEAAFIIEECRRFWESLQSDEPPDLDDTVATYECIKELHPEIDGTTVQIDPDEAMTYAQRRIEFAAAQDALALECNRVLKRMEQAQYAVVGDVQVARRQRGSRGGVSFYPSKTITPDRIRQLTEGNNEQ
jgi:predicted phage-related endonuclease